MTGVHRIRLAGPWDVSALESAAGTAEPLPAAARMTMPARWSDQGWVGFAGRVRHARRFGKPGNLSARETVWLTFAGVTGTATVRLNGAVLGPSAPDTAVGRFEVTGMLRERNLLEVDVDGGPDGGLWGEIALEIRQIEDSPDQPSR